MGGVLGDVHLQCQCGVEEEALTQVRLQAGLNWAGPCTHVILVIVLIAAFVAMVVVVFISAAVAVAVADAASIVAVLWISTLVIFGVCFLAFVSSCLLCFVVAFRYYQGFRFSFAVFPSPRVLLSLRFGDFHIGTFSGFF